MKAKRILLSFVLICCGIFAMFSLTACGEISVATVKENFESLYDIYAQHADVFKTGMADGMQTDYVIDYKALINGYVSSDTDGFKELEELYNVTLAISHDYIDSNLYILDWDESYFKGDKNENIKQLNESLDNYKNYISEFLSARDVVIQYFDKFDATANQDAKDANLRKFKRVYGELINRNIDLSMKLAKCIESTEIFDLLKQSGSTSNASKLLKDYIRAKLLPIYSECLITEFESKLNWNGTAPTQTKDRIDDILSELNAQFETYKTKFVSTTGILKTMTIDDVNKFLNMVEEFFIEADNYFTALNGVDFGTLAEYNNNLEEYKSANQYAEQYLLKLEQFTSETLPSFISNSISCLYA